MRQVMVIVAMIGVIAMAGTAMAANYNFAGPGTAWGTDANWSAAPPGASNNVGGGDTFTVGGAFSPIQAGAPQIEVGSTLDGASAGAGTGALNVSTTGTLSFGGGLFMGRDRDAQITQTSGTVAVSGLGIGMGVGAGGEISRYDMDGGTLTNALWTFVGENPDTFTFDQTAGSVTLGDGSGADYFRMSPYADPGGVSLYQISGGDMTINSGTNEIGIGYALGTTDGGDATFKVIGTGPTAVTFNGNTQIGGGGTQKGKLAFTMDASGVTPIALTGTLTLIDSPDLVLDLGALGAVGDILLVNNDGADAISGTFNGLAEGAPVGSGYTLTYLGDTGNDLVLVAAPIPEPAGLGLIGLALLAVRRKRS